mgnify:CR=1 FL=1
MASAAEPSVENLFSGRVLGHDVEGGVTILDLALGQGITRAARRGARARQRVTMAVRAEDVIVARKAPRGFVSSQPLRGPDRRARPRRRGRHASLRAPGGEGKLEWIVRVTPSAAASLGLAVGQAAYLAVKSHSVRLV